MPTLQAHTDGVLVSRHGFGEGGWVRFGAWTWVFSSKLNTAARSGGARCSPTTSTAIPSDQSKNSVPCRCLAGHRGVRAAELNPAGCRGEVSAIVCAEVGGQAPLVPAIRGL